MFDLIHFSKWNTEIGFFGGITPSGGVGNLLSEQQWEPWDSQGKWLCSGPSPAWLYPGKYHKVPMPLSARWQVAYTTLGRFLMLFWLLSLLFEPGQRPQLLGTPEAGACMSLVLYCAVYLPQKEMWGRRMHGGSGIMELGTFHPWCPFGGGSSACMMAVLSSPTVLPCVVIPWVPRVWHDCCTVFVCWIWKRSVALARWVGNEELVCGCPDAMSFPVAFHYGKTPPRTLLGWRSASTHCYFWLLNFRYWLGMIWK